MGRAVERCPGDGTDIRVSPEPSMGPHLQRPETGGDVPGIHHNQRKLVFPGAR